MELVLKRGDVIKVKHAVALIGMDAGEYYRVEYTKKHYNEERCFLSNCDENGAIKEGDVIDIAVRELEFWAGEESIEMVGK
jgi:hypothetical protein